MDGGRERERETERERERERQRERRERDREKRRENILFVSINLVDKQADMVDMIKRKTTFVTLRSPRFCFVLMQWHLILLARPLRPIHSVPVFQIHYFPQM